MKRYISCRYCLKMGKLKKTKSGIVGEENVNNIKSKIFTGQ